jgi:hypothetical protein
VADGTFEPVAQESVREASYQAAVWQRGDSERLALWERGEARRQAGAAELPACHAPATEPPVTRGRAAELPANRGPVGAYPVRARKTLRYAGCYGSPDAASRLSAGMRASAAPETGSTKVSLRRVEMQSGL